MTIYENIQLGLIYIKCTPVRVMMKIARKVADPEVYSEIRQEWMDMIIKDFEEDGCENEEALNFAMKALGVIV